MYRSIKTLLSGLSVYLVVSGAPLCAHGLALPSAPSCAPRELKIVNASETPETAKVTLETEIKGPFLHARFRVQNPDLYAKEKLEPGEYPYQYDVVELFVAPQGAPFPYFEFELSPFDQEFQVGVLNTSKDRFLTNPNRHTRHAVLRTPGGWIADWWIDLTDLGWKGQAVTGNAYAILGAKPHRRYFSLNMAPTPRPNFHRPEFFVDLVRCPGI
jgi:hypothetical protein